VKPKRRSTRSPLGARRATIRDVAERAGVSTATVSFVLNKNPNESFTDAVRQRVLGAARALNYSPSAAAVGLPRKRMRNIGLIFHEGDELMTNSFYSFIVQGAVKEAVAHRYNLLFSYVDGGYEGFEDLPKMVRENNAEGVLFMRRAEPAMIRDITELGISVMLVDTFPHIGGVNAFQIDNVRGGALAAEHLMSLGHTKVAMLLPKKPVPSFAQRLLGFRRAFEQAGKRFGRPEIVEADDLNYHAAHAAAGKLLRKKTHVTALFCANDHMAAGALRAAHEAGYQVPDDLSLVGFDDINMSRYTEPPLTTIGVSKEEMGRRAMARLIDLVEGRGDRATVEIAPVSLVVRDSTAKAKR
jgi:LacI family transcriptional regulator